VTTEDKDNPLRNAALLPELRRRIRAIGVAREVSAGELDEFVSRALLELVELYPKWDPTKGALLTYARKSLWGIARKMRRERRAGLSIDSLEDDPESPEHGAILGELANQADIQKAHGEAQVLASEAQEKALRRDELMLGVYCELPLDEQVASWEHARAEKTEDQVAAEGGISKSTVRRDWKRAHSTIKDKGRAESLTVSTSTPINDVLSTLPDPRIQKPKRPRIRKKIRLL
jgi:RNA polymerase sigma factor (sigma-70 family)